MWRDTTASPQGTCTKIVSEILKDEKTFRSVFPSSPKRQKGFTQRLLDHPSALQIFPIF